MRKLLAGLAFVSVGVLATTAPVMAGDGYGEPRPFRWTGLYVGAHVGHGWADWDGRLTYADSPFYGDPWKGIANRSIEANGWLGGGQIGFNKQVGNVVFGVEVDGSWAGIEDEKTFTTLDYPYGAGDGKKDYTWRIKTQIDAMGTVRGRLGVVAGPVLLYGTAGVAFARTSGDLVVTGYEGQGFPASGEVTAVGAVDENHIGYAVGGGLEWAMGGGWSMKAEYVFVDLGSAQYRLTGTAYPDKPPCAGPASASCSFAHMTDSFPADLTLHTIRLGMNYRFGE